MLEKNGIESKTQQRFSGDKDQTLDETTSSMSRRKFIKIGAISITGLLISGGVVRELILDRGEDRKIERTLPFQNPAFSWNLEEDGGILCSTTDGKGRKLMYRLNNAGGEIWHSCNGKRPPEEVAGIVAEKFGLDYNVFLKDTIDFLKVLDQQNLIVTKGKFVRFKDG